MKIEELISGKNDQDNVNLDVVSIPVSSLKRLIGEGYVHIKPYRENNTFSFWGKTCSACLTLEQLQERA